MIRRNRLMKKMIKRIASLAAVIAVSAAMLVGCGYSILCHHMITMSQHNLGSPLYIKNLFPKQLRIDYCCHILALCRECKLAKHLCTFAQLHIIGALPVEPQKKSCFSGITDSLYHSAFFIEICSRVDSHARVMA